eukprot:3192444-Rhodomonas_salina.1
MRLCRYCPALSMRYAATRRPPSRREGGRERAACGSRLTTETLARAEVSKQKEKKEKKKKKKGRGAECGTELAYGVAGSHGRVRGSIEAPIPEDSSSHGTERKRGVPCPGSVLRQCMLPCCVRYCDSAWCQGRYCDSIACCYECVM